MVDGNTGERPESCKENRAFGILNAEGGDNKYDGGTLMKVVDIVKNVEAEFWKMRITALQLCSF